jgi:hypothetical protein
VYLSRSAPLIRWHIREGPVAAARALPAHTQAHALITHARTCITTNGDACVLGEPAVTRSCCTLESRIPLIISVHPPLAAVGSGQT